LYEKIQLRKTNSQSRLRAHCYKCRKIQISNGLLTASHSVALFATRNFPRTEAKKGDGARADMSRECYREALYSFPHNSLVVSKKKEFQFVTCYALNAIYALRRIEVY